MNRYYTQRMRERHARKERTRKAQQTIRQETRFIEVDLYLTNYETAYYNAYGRRCNLVYRTGWVYMAECATFRVRLKALGGLAAELQDAYLHDRRPRLVGAPVDVKLDEPEVLG